MFKIGDLVQVKDRDWVIKYYDGSSNCALFLGPMEIIGFRDPPPGLLGVDGEFSYPNNSGTYYWPLADLELIPQTQAHCQCPITLLMNRGCQCGAVI